MQILTPGSDRSAVWNTYCRADYATWPVGMECEMHSHDDAGEFFVFLAGACEITVEGETRVVPAGNTVYVGPDEKHKLKAVGDRPLEMFLAVFPNHEPTHTFYHPDGTKEGRNRPAPPGATPQWTK